MKQTLKIIAISIVILLLFRGCIYRWLIGYTEIGTRPEIKVNNQKLIDKIEAKSANKLIDTQGVIAIANGITTEELAFTMSKASNDPNELINSKRANCVGYATMFNSIANYLIRTRKLEKEIEAKHKIGQLYLLEINLHQFFESAFFQDHDYNEIKHKKTGKIIVIDPSVSDYLWINRVTEN